ncbi:Tryprostatin B 6-hydroxylase [Cyphellophora attinorum]|uniref:Tryprostatin B 6-hydroxylase n=1 Tax=Cyphellophora attinorum TaxID=1664694 RepID=A0A0N0NRC1_9EURO|nr:Tryprostatin B 6-hydroxylase [Phialophora attinorum]KPI44659.1 Tryprostatin B 6-hydroxylase [Phialophora attinorum]
MARITQFWLPYNVSERADSAWFIDRLHKKYGEYVRIGPNLLSIADPDMVEPIHAPGTRFTKGQWYDVAKPLTTVQQMREKHMHDRHRKSAWDPAFTASSLRNYDPRILKHANKLMSHLRNTSGQSVNATQWMSFFSFDVMGDLSFGKHFGLLETGKPHLYMELVHTNGRAFGVFGSCGWLLHTVMALIPEEWTPMNKMLLYSREAIKDRKAYEPALPDIMSSLLKVDRFMSSAKDEDLLLEGNKLRQELVENGIRDDDTFEVSKVAKLPYLNAVIDEALRMHPPTPGGLHRKPPPEGVRLGDHYIPGEIQVLTPTHSIQHSIRAFVKPDEFIPERWTTQPELILNKQAFFPFSMNSWGCIGKQLAYNELRTVVSKLVLGFDMTFAPGEDGTDILTKSQDVFTVTCAPLHLVFTPVEA